MQRVAVIGLGYVGLPLALLAAKKGFSVVGYDRSQSKVSSLRRGEIYLAEEEPYLEGWFADAKEICWTTDENDLAGCSIKIICVPTPVDEKYLPDLSFVRSAAEVCARHLEKDDLVVVESTIYPGTCEEIVAPALDAADVPYLLAHCPERINPGDERWNVSNIPRVVGGLDEVSTAAAEEFYSALLDASVTPVSQLKAAEATKILENTFRDVNIAFVNEMAQSFSRLGIDTGEVIRGASTKPFAFLPHYPGAGVGGHCIAVDPYYMIERGKKMGFQHDFLIQARRINSSMPGFTVSLVQDGLNDLGLAVKGSTVAVLGISYKPGVGDDRESPYYKIRSLLQEKGAAVRSFDPYFPEQSDGSLHEVLKGADCALVVTAHKEFLDLGLYGEVKLVVDGRNCLDRKSLGVSGPLYRGIGIR